MRIHFWNIFFGLLYIFAFVAGLNWLIATHHLVAWVPLGDFVLIALAIHRLVRLVTYDEITEFVRDWFKGADSRTFLGTLGVLINCPWCTGLWWALFVVFAYFASPLAWYVILVLALASIGTTFQLFTNWLGAHSRIKTFELEDAKTKKAQPNVCTHCGAEL